MVMSTSKSHPEFTRIRKSSMINKQQPPKAGMRAVNAIFRSSASAADSQDSNSSGAPKQKAARRRGSQASRGSSVGRRRGSSVSQKRGSLLSERRSSELQLDNADRLSGFMLNCKQVMDELDIDYESDFDE